MNIKLLGYAPDVDPTVIGVLTNCSSVVPTMKGFKGAPSPAATTLANLAATCQGSAALSKLDTSVRFFAGTGTKLYEASGSTWTDVSRASTYTGNSTQRWRLAQYGDVSIAVNGADTVQFSNSAGAFADISGAPKAAVVEVTNDFVFLANTNDTIYGISPDRWWCSALGNYASWSPSIATQAATGRLTSTAGPITALKKLGSAIILYKQKSLYFGSYVGAPIIWAFEQIEGEVGAMSQEAVVNIGTPDNPKHLFMGFDNFYFFDGSKPVPVGTNRVKIQVFNAINQSRYYACAALHDRINSLVYFYYPIADSPLPDHCVVYNYRTDSWGTDDRQVDIPVEYVAPGITYDLLGTSYTTYDSLPNLAYDSAFLGSNVPIPAIFDTNHSPKTLTGASASSSFTTGDIGDDVFFTNLERVRPRFITAPSSATLVNYYKNNEGDSLTTDVTSSLSSGKFDLLREARWHRLMLTLVGDWEMAEISAEFSRGSLE